MSIGSFFSGGSNAVSFPTIGTFVTGTITAVHPPEPVIDPATRQPSTDKTGRTKMQIRIELATDQRDPADEFDDGSRTLYVKSWMSNAIGEALRKAGKAEPEIGGKLTVTFTAEEPSAPGLNPAKKYTAAYVPPVAGKSTAVADHFDASAPGSGSVSNGPVKPDSITAQAWAAMDESTRQAVSATMVGMSDSPPF